MAMKTGDFRKLNGEVESDETFVGGKAKNMHKARREQEIQGRGAVGKTIVHGLLERTCLDDPSQVRCTVVPNTEASTLMPIVAQNVEEGTTVYTDALSSYGGLASRFEHEFIDHATKYVEGRVHVNGMENFWSLLKRGLKGTYVHVAAWHLFRYVDEEVFRFNERWKDDAGRFRAVMLSLVGKRLTYRRLAMVDGCGFMGIE
jgi:transposase-like protein